MGNEFNTKQLPNLLQEHNADREEPMPWLAALVCSSLFDRAVHDAFGNLHGKDIYQTYNAQWMNYSLEHFLEPAVDCDVDFEGKYPEDFFVENSPVQMPAWHLVGGVDPLDEGEITGNEPEDDYPVLLADWIQTDGLKCLKIKLRGNDSEWDYARLLKVGSIAIELSLIHI